MKNGRALMNVFYFFFFFLVFYIQPIEFGSVRGTVLIELGLFPLLLARIFFKKNIKSDAVAVASLVVALKILVNSALFDTDTAASVFFEFCKFLVFPLFYFNFKNYLKSAEAAVRIIKFLAIFIILSGIPFMVHVLEPLSAGYNLDNYGDDTGTAGYIGLFVTPQAISTALSLAILNLYYFTFIKVSVSKALRPIYVAIMLLGMVQLYETYVRTGYLVVIAGFFTFYYKLFKWKYIGYYMAVIVVCAGLAIFIFEKDKVLQNRLLDKREYTTGDAQYEAGAGRLRFQVAGFQVWEEAGIGDKFFGIGIQNMENKMYQKLGLHIHTHNGFTTAFTKEGVIGFIIFIYYMVALYRKVKESRSSDYYLLALGIWVGYFYFQLVQGGVITPVIEIFVVLNMVILDFPSDAEVAAKKARRLAAARAQHETQAVVPAYS